MMDTSEKYILMSSKAKKILGKSLWLAGDFYAYRIPARVIENSDKDAYPVGVFSGNYRDYGMTTDGEPFNSWIPLYRQDQLQKMVDDYNIYSQISRFDKWTHDVAFYQGVQWSSMEQLWLAFVMHEKYQKQWDKEKKEWTGLT